MYRFLRNARDGEKVITCFENLAFGHMTLTLLLHNCSSTFKKNKIEKNLKSYDPAQNIIMTTTQ